MRAIRIWSIWAVWPVFRYAPNDDDRRLRRAALDTIGAAMIHKNRIPSCEATHQARQDSFSFPAVPLTRQPSARLSCRSVRLARSATVIVVAMLIRAAIAVADPLPPNTASDGGQTAGTLAAFVSEASQRFGLPRSWLIAVMQAESGGDPGAVSPKGAIGLMQIMPDTWSDLRDRYGLGDNPFDVHDNIVAGAAYLRELYDQCGSTGFLAAYNAGPARYEAFLVTGQPLPDDTRNYVAMLEPLLAGEHIGGRIIASSAVPWPKAPLFAGQHNDTTIASGSASVPPSGGRSIDAVTDNLATLAPRPDGLFVRFANRNTKP